MLLSASMENKQALNLSDRFDSFPERKVEKVIKLVAPWPLCYGWPPTLVDSDARLGSYIEVGKMGARSSSKRSFLEGSCGDHMIRLIAIGLALAVASSAQAMLPAAASQGGRYDHASPSELWGGDEVE